MPLAPLMTNAELLVMEVNRMAVARAGRRQHRVQKVRLLMLYNCY